MKTFKLGSGDLNNEEFLNEIPKLNINLIVSTGMAYWQEIANAVDAYKSLPNFAILQCTSKYPTPLSEVGLNVMTDIKNRFGVLAGLSDHTGSIADLIEKHVIFDKKMFGPDITSSITFEQLDELSRIRDDFILVKQQVDKDKVATELTEIRALFGRSLGLKESRPVGYVIENVNEFCMRKPAGGLPWSSRDQFLGKKLRRNYVAGEFLTIDHLDSANT
jgi:N-acetylneuraminate synthase